MLGIVTSALLSIWTFSFIFLPAFCQCWILFWKAINLLLDLLDPFKEFLKLRQSTFKEAFAPGLTPLPEVQPSADSDEGPECSLKFLHFG